MLYGLVDEAAILVSADKIIPETDLWMCLPDRPVLFEVSRRICVGDEIPEPSTGKLQRRVGQIGIPERYGVSCPWTAANTRGLS